MQACKSVTFVPEGAPAQVQVAQGGERAQRTYCPVAHARAARHRQPLQPCQCLQRKHSRVTDLQRILPPELACLKDARRGASPCKSHE